MDLSHFAFVGRQEIIYEEGAPAFVPIQSAEVTALLLGILLTPSFPQGLGELSKLVGPLQIVGWSWWWTPES